MDPVTALVVADGLLTLGLKVYQVASKERTPEEEQALLAELKGRIETTLAAVEAYQPKPLPTE